MFVVLMYSSLVLCDYHFSVSHKPAGNIREWGIKLTNCSLKQKELTGKHFQEKSRYELHTNWAFVRFSISQEKQKWMNWLKLRKLERYVSSMAETQIAFKERFATCDAVFFLYRPIKKRNWSRLRNDCCWCYSHFHWHFHYKQCMKKLTIYV